SALPNMKNFRPQYLFRDPGINITLPSSHKRRNDSNLCQPTRTNTIPFQKKLCQTRHPHQKPTTTESIDVTFSVAWRGPVQACSGPSRAEFSAQSCLPALEKEKAQLHPMHRSALFKSAIVTSASIKQPTRM